MNKIRSQQGATLIELVLAIVVIGVALVAMLSIFRNVTIGSADPMPKMQAIMIGDSLLEEVLSKSFIKPSGGFAGPFTVGNRSQFDTVTDYNGLTFSGISILSGVTIPNLSQYSATINVSNVGLGIVPSSNVDLVTVTVSGFGYVYKIDGYKIKYE
jgi:MSHA pilin protein MshD